MQTAVFGGIHPHFCFLAPQTPRQRCRRQFSGVYTRISAFLHLKSCDKDVNGCFRGRTPAFLPSCTSNAAENHRNSSLKKDSGRSLPPSRPKTAGSQSFAGLTSGCFIYRCFLRVRLPNYSFHFCFLTLWTAYTKKKTSADPSRNPPTISVNQCTPEISLPSTISAANARHAY